MASIFPSVEVSIIRPLQAGTKTIPVMPVGLVGPMFKRITETKLNSYTPTVGSTLDVSMQLSGASSSQYIDYDSIEVQLQVAGSDEIVVLNPEDKEVIPAETILQNNLSIDSATTGFYLYESGPHENIFFPSTQDATTYNAEPGDWLYLQNQSGTIFEKIKQVKPVKLTPSNFPGYSSFAYADEQLTWLSGSAFFENIVTNGNTLNTTRHYLVLTNKLNPSIIKQFKIKSINNSTNVIVTLDDQADGFAGGIIDSYGTHATTDNFFLTPSSVNDTWSFAIYDMPIGGLITYPATDQFTQYTSGLYVSGENNYQILDVNFKISTQGAVDNKYGKFAKVGNDYIFMPDKRTTASYFGATKGDYLRAFNSQTNAEVDFRILEFNSEVLRSISQINNIIVDYATISGGTNNYSITNGYSVDLADAGLSVDGVDFSGMPEGKLVLVKNQTDTLENGIYEVVRGATQPSRHLQLLATFDSININEIWPYTVVEVLAGTANGGKNFRLATFDTTIETSALSQDWAAPAADHHFYNIGSDISSVATANESYLIAKNKLDPEKLRIYTITAINGNSIVVTNLDFSSNGTGGNNAFILGSFSDWSFSVYRMPPNSLLVETTDIILTNLLGSTSSSSISNNWKFSIVNRADYYMTGKNELSIVNTIGDIAGDAIGLADVVVTYNVLETEFADQLWDITTQEDFQLVCGIAGNYNPLGLASALVEINTDLSYKVIPCNINLSERDPDNPKSYIGKRKIGVDSPNYHSTKNLDWVSAFDVLNQVRDTQIPYYICPLSQDPSVIGLATSTVIALSAPSKMKEMVTFISGAMVNKDVIVNNILPLSVDFSIVDGVLRYKPTTQYVSSDNPAEVIDFLSLGIKKGDYVTAKLYNTNGTKDISFKIMNIYADYLDLGDTEYANVNELITQIDTDLYISIERIYNSKQILAENLAKKSSSYGSYRVKYLWGDLCDVTLSGVTFTRLPSFYVAAAYAAMATLRGVVIPKTNWPINGITKIYNVTPYFNTDQLEIIGEGFMDILTQDFDGGPIYSKRQFMTDGSELSGVEVVDELAKYIRISFRPYLGKYNIDKPLFDVLGLVLSSIVTTYVPFKLNGIRIIKPFSVTGINSDRLSLRLRAETKRPFNGLDVEIEVA